MGSPRGHHIACVVKELDMEQLVGLRRVTPSPHSDMELPAPWASHLFSLGLLSPLLHQGTVPRAGLGHPPARPATGPGPGAVAPAPAGAQPGQRPPAACSQPPVSAAGAAGHPADAGGRAR